MKEKGDLPVNLIVLIEGEEEIGSPNLAPFLDAHREALACDVVVISDSGMVAPGHPTFTYGLRGLAALCVACHHIDAYRPYPEPALSVVPHWGNVLLEHGWIVPRADDHIAYHAGRCPL